MIDRRILLSPRILLSRRTLPIHVLKLISEFSKPVTRPDWRTFERKINTIFFIQSIEQFNKFNVYKLVKQNMAMSHFYIAYHHIYYFGIESYTTLHSEDKRVVLSNKILNKRYESYKNYVFMHLHGFINRI
jgi:hypothetical protein